MLDRFAWLVGGLVVHPERMRANLEAGHWLFASQRVLLALVEAGLARDRAYRLVQRHATRAWDEGISFRDLVSADHEITESVEPETLAALFSLDAYTRHVDTVFERLRSLVRKEESVHA
jgi:adenylosuccinate lyase